MLYPYYALLITTSGGMATLGPWIMCARRLLTETSDYVHDDPHGVRKEDVVGLDYARSSLHVMAERTNGRREQL